MRPYREAFLHVSSTPAALLRREACRNPHHHMTGSLSLIREDIEKCAPTRVVNALGEVVIPYHSGHVQVFHTDATVALGIALGRLEMEVAALAADLEMLARHFAVCFAATIAAFLATADGALRVGQTLLSAAKVARILR